MEAMLIGAISDAAGSLFSAVGDIGTSFINLLRDKENNAFAYAYQTEENVNEAFNNLNKSKSETGTYTIIALALVVLLISVTLFKKEN